MKRKTLAVSLIIFCLAAAVVYAVPYFQRARGIARRQQYSDEAARNEVPLALDAKTSAILAGADRVETFRLVDFHEEENYTEAERDTASASRIPPLDDHQVLRIGPPQDKSFAAALRQAVARTPSPIRKDGFMSGTPSCFDPGVGFRVWRGTAYVDLCVCFYCTAVEIDTKDAPHHFKQKLMTNLGTSRPAYLTLSKEAFPNDARLAALK